jgi:8-oxo-dGTP diphosphatase
MGSVYGGKVRVRACGLLVRDGALLLLRHEGIGPGGHLWSPPGGGVDFGSTAEETVKREFLEETGLQVDVLGFLFANEHLDDIHHAIELFFEVRETGGTLILGSDPEEPHQILTEVAFMDWTQIRLLPPSTVHRMFSTVDSLESLFGLRGYLKFVKSEEPH